MNQAMDFKFKTLWLVCFFSFFLISCSDADKKESKEIKSSPASTTVTSESETKKDPKIKQDEHAGHNHGETAAPIEDRAVTSSDYDVFDKPYATENDEQVIVYEFFGYSCPHCFSFQPYMEKWLEDKPDHVKLVRVPVNFFPNNDSWKILQQAYLTSEVMGISEESHNKLFKAIHKGNKRFNTIEDLAQWFADEIDVNKDEFLGTANSFILDSKLRQADNMTYKMQITSTPTVIVNGKLRPSKKIRDRDSIMKVIDYLVEKETKSMGLATE